MNSDQIHTLNRELLAGYRELFRAEMRIRKARGMTCLQFQEGVRTWAISEGRISEGDPWLTDARAAEAYQDPSVFAYDVMTNPQSLLIALEMFGRLVPTQDHDDVGMAWMAERSNQ